MAYRLAIHESTGALMCGAPPVTVTPPDYTEYAWNLREQVRTVPSRP